MAQEQATVARPYAEAIFSRAQETGQLDEWSSILDFLAQVVRNPEIAGLISSPKLSAQQVEALVLEIGAAQLGLEGANLVKLLVQNDRLGLVPEIALQFEQLKREHQGLLKVRVVAAFPIEDDQRDAIAAALKARLNREIEVAAETDPALLGGMIIRAGDLVIDGSVRGQLDKLAAELRI